MVDARYLIEGSTLGLSTGYLCLATCGPIYAPFLMQHSQAPLRYVLGIVELSLGRFSAYLLVGAIAGLFGRHVTELQRDYFTIAAYPLFSAFLVISALRSSACEKGCAASRWSRFSQWPFLLGVLTGINVCPSFLLAFSRSFTLSGPLAGMLFFTAFFAGTSVFLVPLSFVGMLGRKKQFRMIARAAAFAVAAWFIGSAGQTAYRMIKERFDPRPIICLLDNAPMYVLAKDPEKAHRLAAALALQRTGPVHILHGDRAEKRPAQPYYMVADSVLGGAGEARRPGRFLVIVSDRYWADSSGGASIIGFLRLYHFRFNVKTGDVFFFR
jgi:sulfite exporter TauE/SafE